MPDPAARVAQVRLRHRGCISERFTGAAFAARIAADERWNLIAIEADTPAACAAHVAAFRRYSTGPLLALVEDGTSVLFRSRNPPDDVVRALWRADCSFLYPSIYRDGFEHHTVLAPSRERLDDLVARWDALGEARVVGDAPLTTARVALSVRLGALLADLTPRQLSLFLRAARDGYYDIPRRSSALALARAADVGRTTFEEHLRKAERTLLSGVAAEVSTYPFLDRAATRKPGRRPRA